MVQEKFPGLQGVIDDLKLIHPGVRGISVATLLLLKVIRPGIVVDTLPPACADQFCHSGYGVRRCAR